jgi:hypothetical protein
MKGVLSHFALHYILMIKGKEVLSRFAIHYKLMKVKVVDLYPLLLCLLRPIFVLPMSPIPCLFKLVIGGWGWGVVYVTIPHIYSSFFLLSHLAL